MQAIKDMALYPSVDTYIRSNSEVTRVFTWYAHESRYIDKVTGSIAEVRNWIEKLDSSVNKQDSISFISLHFSRTDVATCMSNATAQTLFPVPKWTSTVFPKS
jgi:hypothetical protein